MKNFLILTNEYKDKDLALTKEIKKYLEERECFCEYMVSRGEGAPCNLKEELKKYEDKGIELIIVLGGDGTLIRVASATIKIGAPLIGVNLGTLGYLCELEESTVFPALDKILSGEYEVENRMRLSGHPEVSGAKTEPKTALNDIVIHRAGGLTLVNIIINVNGEYLQTIKGDGVIISTPTGSTGYNMSAFGPIVDPKARMLLITPINAHSLNARSIVLDAEDELLIEIGERGSEDNGYVEVGFDGDNDVVMKPGDKILIHHAKADCKILKLSRLSFLEILRRKMQ